MDDPQSRISIGPRPVGPGNRTARSPAIDSLAAIEASLTVEAVDDVRSAAPARVANAPVVLVGAAAGLVAASAGTTPTAHPIVDATIIGACVAIVTIVGARATWHVRSMAATAAVVIAIDPLLIVVALAALALTIAPSARRIERPAISAVALAATANVLVRARLEGFLGLSAIVGSIVATVVFVVGLRRHSMRIRRIAAIAASGIALFTIVAAGAIAYEVLHVRSALNAGQRAAERGVAALEDAKIDEATDWFRQSAAHLDHAADRLGRPWTALAITVPGLAQNRDAVVNMSTVGATGAAAVVDALETIDLDALRVSDGTIDLDALAALRAPLRDVRTSLRELQVATVRSRSPWLVSRASAALDDFDQSIAEHVPSIDNALGVLGVAPDMLGADRPRRYLLLFTTPSEARGLGGFIGSYAELVVDDGRLSLTHAGSAVELDRAALAAGARLDGPAGFLSQYGRFGYDRPSGEVGDAAFRNLTMTAHFPWVGEIAADLYSQTTGRAVDGVILADPFVLAEVLAYTGPVHIAAYDEELDHDNAIQYLLVDQYVVGADPTERRESLTEAATAAFDAVMTMSLPDPLRLAQDFGPLVDERRLLFWSRDTEQQALLTRMGIDGAIPPLDGSDGWSFTVSNGVGSKIDSFLHRRAEYDATTNENGETTATLRIQLTNTAPSEGLPRYIIGGGRFGLPPGTSRLYVSVYSALGLDSFVVDGERVDVTTGVERGWNVYSGFIDIPAGATVTIDVTLARVVEDPGTVVTWVQPMATPLEVID